MLNKLDGWFMGFSATLNNISATSISWPSALLVEETGEPRENHRHVTVCHKSLTNFIT
jgi:hypothetical protein